MKKMILRGAAALAVTGVALLGVQSPASAEWKVVRDYPSSQSCQYAGYYGKQAGRWDDYQCLANYPSNTWTLMKWV